MAKTITSFNGGLFSSYLKGRIELEKYSSALQDIENYHLLKYGGLQNRAGTTICERENYDADIRLITFQYNVTQSYVLSFCHNELKILKDGSFLPIQTMASPYNWYQVHQIQYIQVADVMYFTHPDTPVRKLVRNSEDFWEFSEVQSLLEAPFLEYNKTSTSITPSGTSGEITLTSNLPLFEPSHVGRTVELKQTRTNNHTSSAGVWLPVNGTWNFSTQGEWSGRVTLRLSFDGGATSQEYRSYGSTNSSSNYNIDGKEETPNAMISIGSIPSGCTPTLTINDSFAFGVVKMHTYIDSHNIKGTVIRSLDNTAPCKDWAYNAFSDATGYPVGIQIFKDRLVLGGTYAQPSTIFMSAVDDWDNFDTNTGVLASINTKLNTSENIMWLNQERDSLTIGTSGAEFSMTTRNSNESFNGDNLQVKVEGAEGSWNIQSLKVSDVNVFISRDNKTVRVINYDFESDKLQSKNLCALSGTEFLESGIKQLIYKQNPNSELYLVLNNGKMAVLTYDNEENIFGWTIFTTNGHIQSACSLKEGEKDCLYIAVEREIAGEIVLMIEKMSDRNFQRKEDWHFLDCGYFRRYVLATNIITGLDLLSGQEVLVLGDGNILGQFTVENGQIILPREVYTCSVGLSYNCYAQVMDIDSYGNGQSNIPQRKKHNKIYVKLRNSVGLFSGDSRDNLEIMNIHSTSNTWLNNIEPITDTVAININSSHKEEYAPYFAQLMPQAQEILGYASSVSIGT